MNSPTNEGSRDPEIRHSVAERQRFIDRQLFWNARINRADLIKEFKISPAQAAADFREFMKLCRVGLRYDTRAKAYLASDAYEPVFGLPDADEGLQGMRGIGDPLVAELPQLDRPLDARIAAKMRRAARDRQRVHIRYQSFTKPRPRWRWIAPSVFVSDGLRWHVRAWCYTDLAWKDFVLARILEFGELEPAGDLPTDKEWSETIELVLVPAEHLSADQKACVKSEYGMRNGCLRMRIPSALKIYALRRWGLDRPDSRLLAKGVDL